MSLNYADGNPQYLKYRCALLKCLRICTLFQASFSEQCYYTFGDIATAMAACNIRYRYNTYGTVPSYGSGTVPRTVPTVPKEMI